MLEYLKLDLRINQTLYGVPCNFPPFFKEERRIGRRCLILSWLPFFSSQNPTPVAFLLAEKIYWTGIFPQQWKKQWVGGQAGEGLGSGTELKPASFFTESRPVFLLITVLIPHGFLFMQVPWSAAQPFALDSASFFNIKKAGWIQPSGERVKHYTLTTPFCPFIASMVCFSF